MSAGSWPEVEALLDAALDLPPAARAALLEDPTTGAPAIRAEVRRLLDLLDEAEEFLGEAAAEYAAPLLALGVEGAEADGAPPARVGPYRVLGEAGQGGMGTVYLAERDDEHFRQRVALKLLRGAGATDPHLLRRFREERQILASLEHPHIARLLDGGVTGDGVPFFAMEYVEGVPIDRFCDERGLAVEQRVTLFRAVCDGVQYAHRKLVVHRDLKPSNILVTAAGSPKLLDFGIAKLLEAGSASPAGPPTSTGMRLMTPEYASPEQVRGEPVSTASDVYSLGVLLYLLLSGRPPYAAPPRRPHELARSILETEPERPSAVAPAALRRRLRGDLDTIVLRALQKEPERRYASVQALADDLERHLAGHPVRARPDTARYRAGRFVRRHRAGVAAAAVLLLSLSGGLAGTAWQAREATREAERAEAVRAFVVSLFQASDPAESRGDEITARELLDRGAARAGVELARSPAVHAEMLGVLGAIYRDLGSYARAEPLLREAAELLRAARGARHRETAAAQHELAHVLALMDRRAEAESLYREALGVRRSLLGAGHPEVARSLGGLAAVLGRSGDHEQAERLHREALAIHLRHSGEDDPGVADAMDALGSLLRAKGDLAGAEEVWRRTLAARSRVLGPDHLATATSTNNLALLLSDRGELEEAEALYREVLDFDLRRLGEEHPYTATVMNNLASVLRRRGELDEAERLYRRALDIDRRLLGEAHPKVATVLNNLAAVLRDRGDLEGSERLYREALAAFRAANGDDHASVGTAYSVLAGVVYLRGDATGAERMYRQGLDILGAAFPDGHLRTSAAQLGLGRLLVERGRAAEAEPLLAEALETRVRSLGREHARTGEALTELGASLLAQRRYAEAGALLREGHAMLARLGGSENERSLQRAARQLAALRAAQAAEVEANRLRTPNRSR
jgi:eukaryotic-like serine/threonine-protein kinase